MASATRSLTLPQSTTTHPLSAEQPLLPSNIPFPSIIPIPPPTTITRLPHLQLPVTSLSSITNPMHLMVPSIHELYSSSLSRLRFNTMCPSTHPNIATPPTTITRALSLHPFLPSPTSSNPEALTTMGMQHTMVSRHIHNPHRIFLVTDHQNVGRSPSKLSDGASICHLQYNSPMNLYSAETAAEQFEGQTGRPAGYVASVQKHNMMCFSQVRW